MCVIEFRSCLDIDSNPRSILESYTIGLVSLEGQTLVRLSAQ